MKTGCGSTVVAGRLAGMTLSISRLHSTDEAGIAKLVQVVEDVRLHEAPLLAPMTRPQVRAILAHPFADQRSEHYLAELGSQPVGRLFLRFPQVDNLEQGHLMIEVAPQARRRGIGRRLLDFAWERARANGRRRLSCITAWHLPELASTPPDDCGAGFARAHGFCAALDSVQLRVELDTLPLAALDELIQQAEGEATGYQVVRWRGRAPEQYVNDLAYLSSRMMADAPTGDLGYESENIDAARYRREERTYLDRGEAGWHTCARHLDSGRLVAWTTIRHHHVDWHAQQGNTIVEPRHRGHGLGLLVKAVNLRWLAQECPTVRAIDTYNAVENSHMVAINERLGYRPLYAWQHWQRELPA